MRSFRGNLPAARLAQCFDVPQGLVDRRLKVGEINRLGQEIEGAAIHRGADIGHVAIGGHDDRGERVIALLDFLQEGQPVHARHVDVAHHHVDTAAVPQHFERLGTVAGEQKPDLAIPDLAPEFLLDEGLEIGLVIDQQDRRSHASPLARW